MISGEKIKRIRLARGISQKALAEEVKCPKAYISKIENFAMIPSEELYNKIIKAIYSLPNRNEKEQ